MRLDAIVEDLRIRCILQGKQNAGFTGAFCHWSCRAQDDVSATDLELLPCATCAEMLDGRCSRHCFLGALCCAISVERRKAEDFELHNTEVRSFRSSKTRSPELLWSVCGACCGVQALERAMPDGGSREA